MPAQIQITINSSAAGSGIAEAEAGLQRLSKTAEGSGGGFSALKEVAIGALRQVGAALVNVAGEAAQALGQFVGDSVKAAGDFEAGMNQFAAAAGNMGQDEISQFKDLFISLGKELPVSTQEVQDAAITLVRAGIDPAIVKAGALKDSLNFAAAAGMQLADAAELTTKMLGTFGPVTGSAADQVAFMAQAQNLMTKAANASTLDVDKLGDAMLQAAGAAKAGGVAYDDFVTVMGLISPAFGSASEAGTSYKNFLARLIPQTSNATGWMERLGLYTEETGSKFFDSTGKYVGNRQAAELLQGALAGLSDAERSEALSMIFGNDAKGAAIALAQQGADGYDKFAASMANANGVQQQAAATQQGFNFQMENLKGSIEALQITIGTALLPVLSEFIANVVTPGVNTLIAFADAVNGNKDALAQLPAPLAALVGPVQNFIANVSSLYAAFRDGGSSIETAQGLILGFVDSVAAALPGQLQAWAQALGQWVINALPGLGANLATMYQNILTWLYGSLPGIVAQLAVWGQQFTDWVIAALPLLISELGNLNASMLAWIVEKAPGILAQLAVWAGQFLEWAVTTGAKLIVALGEQFGKLLIWIVAKAPELGPKLEEWGKMFVKWISDSWPGWSRELGKLWEQLSAWISATAGKLAADGSVGRALADGIKAGINAGVEGIKRAAESAAKAALDAAKSALGIHSPSAVFAAEVGAPIVQGMAQGMGAGAPMVAASAAGLAGAAVAGGQSVVNSTVSNTYNYNPTYGGSPSSPVTDFRLMATLAGV